MLTARAVQKTCTKTYGKKGVRSGGHHLLIFSNFFRSNRKKNSLIFDSGKAPENISIMSQLLSEEHYRLCLYIFTIWRLLEYATVLWWMAFYILYLCKKEMQQGITLLYSNLPRSTPCLDLPGST